MVPELLPVLPLDEPPMPEPELLPVLGLVGLVGLVVLGLVVLPELEPMLPELEPVLPEPDVLPYCFTQSSRCVPVRPTHWLGVAVGLDVLLDPLPLAPEADDPEPDVLESELVPALPLAAGLVVELPLLLPELCAQETVARPSRAAATAALSVFAITMYAPLVD